ncbi:MAG TPA: hypothetical protein VNM69_01920 [Bacillus sp. (in: firmicutes)]|nr:hypothetical protein [Bacillus sp. (in: firmicutes)]
MNKENILKDLEKVVEHNRLEVEKVDGDQGLAKNVIVLSHEGSSIYNPFVDESGRFEVNPIEYYGMEKILKMIEEFNTKIK